MKGKNEVFTNFKEYKALVENQTERNIKTPRSDNGEEFTSENSRKSIESLRLKRELRTPYNPQRNGFSKRKNRTIMEVAKPMLHDEDLPMHLWEEEARTVVYVQNHTPHRVLNNKTPEEDLLKEKPKFSHLRIFGFLVYIHIPKEKRTKIDPSGRKVCS